jgi:hypothetical protein
MKVRTVVLGLSSQYTTAGNQNSLKDCSKTKYLQKCQRHLKVDQSLLYNKQTLHRSGITSVIFVAEWSRQKFEPTTPGKYSAPNCWVYQFILKKYVAGYSFISIYIYIHVLEIILDLPLCFRVDKTAVVNRNVGYSNVFWGFYTECHDHKNNIL